MLLGRRWRILRDEADVGGVAGDGLSGVETESGMDSLASHARPEQTASDIVTLPSRGESRAKQERPSLHARLSKIEEHLARLTPGSYSPTVEGATSGQETPQPASSPAPQAPSGKEQAGDTGSADVSSPLDEAADAITDTLDAIAKPFKGLHLGGWNYGRRPK